MSLIPPLSLLSAPTFIPSPINHRLADLCITSTYKPPPTGSKQALLLLLQAAFIAYSTQIPLQERPHFTCISPNIDYSNPIAPHSNSNSNSNSNIPCTLQTSGGDRLDPLRSRTPNTLTNAAHGNPNRPSQSPPDHTQHAPSCPSQSPPDSDRRASTADGRLRDTVRDAMACHGLPYHTMPCRGLGLAWLVRVEVARRTPILRAPD
ncbi:hypothetical protein V492_08218, partial [Pseudogymnoascus sp. VKM F-4246]